MSIDYRKLFVAFIASVVIAIPTAMVFANHSKQIESERQDKSRLQLDIQKKDSELEQIKTKNAETEQQLKQKADEAEQLKQQNEQLQKDLQAKRTKQAEDARLAAIAASGVSGNCQSYRSLVAKYDWDVNTMMRIMNAESSCIPTKHNHADDHRVCLGSYGLFQVGCVHGYAIAYLESPENNIAAAYKIWKSQGYTAWTTY